jgi:hypothetical protein
LCREGSHGGVSREGGLSRSKCERKRKHSNFVGVGVGVGFVVVHGWWICLVLLGCQASSFTVGCWLFVLLNLLFNA